MAHIHNKVSTTTATWFHFLLMMNTNVLLHAQNNAVVVITASQIWVAELPCASKRDFYFTWYGNRSSAVYGISTAKLKLLPEVKQQ